MFRCVNTNIYVVQIFAYENNLTDLRYMLPRVIPVTMYYAYLQLPLSAFIALLAFLVLGEGDPSLRCSSEIASIFFLPMFFHICKLGSVGCCNVTCSGLNK